MVCKRGSSSSVAANTGQNARWLFRVRFQGEKGMNESTCAYCPYRKNKNIHVSLFLGELTRRTVRMRT